MHQLWVQLLGVGLLRGIDSRGTVLAAGGVTVKRFSEIQRRRKRRDLAQHILRQRCYEFASTVVEGMLIRLVSGFHFYYS